MKAGEVGGARRARLLASTAVVTAPASTTTARSAAAANAQGRRPPLAGRNPAVVAARDPSRPRARPPAVERLRNGVLVSHLVPTLWSPVRPSSAEFGRPRATSLPEWYGSSNRAPGPCADTSERPLEMSTDYSGGLGRGRRTLTTRARDPRDGRRAAGLPDRFRHRRSSRSGHHRAIGPCRSTTVRPQEDSRSKLKHLGATIATVVAAVLIGSGARRRRLVDDGSGTGTGRSTARPLTLTAVSVGPSGPRCTRAGRQDGRLHRHGPQSVRGHHHAPRVGTPTSQDTTDCPSANISVDANAPSTISVPVAANSTSSCGL